MNLVGGWRVPPPGRVTAGTRQSVRAMISFMISFEPP
jgi:hypothetical protein